MNTSRGLSLRGQRFWRGLALIALCAVILLADSYAVLHIHVARLGNALDFYPFWAGGQAILLHQHNPYDAEITLQIQQAIYGRPALPEENQHAYAYPAYAPFVALPFVFFPFAVSASLWIASQQVLIVAAVAVTVHATGWQPSRWLLLALCLAAMTFRYSMVTFVLGQTSIWVLFSLSLALWAMHRGKGMMAGLALAASSIKPQLMVLAALALVVTATPRQRRSLILGLTGSLSVLLACSFACAGFWINDYWHQLQAYQVYSSTVFPITAVASSFLPDAAAQVLNVAGVATLLLALVAVLTRCQTRGKTAIAMAMAIVISQLAVPQTGSYNMVLLLLPALVLIGCSSQARGGWDRFALLGQLFGWAYLLVIPWLFWALAKGAGSWPPELLMVPALMLLPLLALCGKQTRCRIPSPSPKQAE